MFWHRKTKEEKRREKKIEKKTKKKRLPFGVSNVDTILLESKSPPPSLEAGG